MLVSEVLDTEEPYHYVQIVSVIPGGDVTSMTWILPDEYAEPVRKEMIRAHGEPASEAIISPDAMTDILAAGAAVYDKNQMTIVFNEENHE